MTTKRRKLSEPAKPRKAVSKTQPKRIVPKHLPSKDEPLPTTTETTDLTPEVNDEDNE